jgi:hypothetical protein
VPVDCYTQNVVKQDEIRLSDATCMNLEDDLDKVEKELGQLPH